MRSGIGRVVVRVGLAGVIGAMSGAAAQPASTATTSAARIDTKQLRARITQLPAQPVDLNRAIVAAPAVSAATPATTPATAASPAASGPAAAARPPAALPAPAPAPQPAARPATVARWVKLPAAEASDTHAVLAKQLQQLRPVARPGPVAPLPDGKASPGPAKGATPPAAAEPPAFVQFDGAVLTKAQDADDELALVPLAMIDSPLRFNAAARRYEGRIAIGLMEVGHVGAARKIATPIGFQVLGDAEIEPPLAQLGSTAPPFQSIRVATQDPREAVELVVHSNVSKEPVRLMLPVERAQLLLSVARGELQGWGLESTEVSVLASNGEASQGQIVLLSARGHLQDTQLMLDAQGSARTTLRSAATGRVQVSASSPRLQPASVPLDYQFPLRFLVAALVGGVAGGVLRRGMKRGGKASRLAQELLLGVLAGAAVLGLFLLGVNVTGFALPSTGGELLVAVVALVGAFVGSKLLAAGSAAAAAKA